MWGHPLRVPLFFSHTRVYQIQPVQHSQHENKRTPKAPLFRGKPDAHDAAPHEKRERIDSESGARRPAADHRKWLLPQRTRRVARKQGCRRARGATGEARQARQPVKQADGHPPPVKPCKPYTDQKKGTHARQPLPKIPWSPTPLFDPHDAPFPFACHDSV